MLAEKAAHPVGAALVERRDVHVRDAGVAPLGLPPGPAHELDALEALGVGEGEHFLELEVGQDRGDEAELHHFTSGTFTQPPFRWLSRTASHSTTSRWPSRKVAKGGGAEKSPFAT